MAVLSKFQAFISKPEQARLALGMVAIAALVIGAWQIRTSLNLTLALPKPADTETEAEDPAEAEAAELQARDSDGDGLSDYDEQYLYRTSAYLKDTDSDGYEDGVEVESGNDPLCPKGQECLRQAPVEGGSIIEQEGAVAPTADEIRALLRQQGATDEQLSQYDDASLLQLYQEVTFEEQSAGTDAGGNETTDSNSSTLTPEQKELIGNMTGQELRQFLIQGGADSEVVSKFDDTTLKSIVLQSLGL